MEAKLQAVSSRNIYSEQGLDARIRPDSGHVCHSLIVLSYCNPGSAQAQAALVSEKDPTAVALGYSSDATKVDAKRFPKYAAGQKCGNCQLYTGKATDASGGCGIFPGKAVAASGWCSAYVKKA